MPNALFSFQEYLLDFASPEVKEKGLKLIEKLSNETLQTKLKQTISQNLDKITQGERDVYL